MSNGCQHDAQNRLTVPPSSEGSTFTRWMPYADSGYLLGPAIAAGGMGSVHLGLKQGALGFRRLLAIKRLHGHLARDPEFVARFKDEIRLVSRLNHPNVVQTFDVVEIGHELALVMEYVEGVTLYELIKDAAAAHERLPIEVIAGVLAQTLHGLHSAHELCDADGKPLQLVHRDVSPQNIMVAKDGLTKMLDFGVAKAASETHVTRAGQLSGKAAYMSPEQALGHAVDRRTDIFAAGIVLWEALTGQRLFRGAGMPETAAIKNVLEMRVRAPSELRADITPALERVVLRALERDPTRRYGSARDFALALEEVVPHASLSTVASGVMVVSRQRVLDLSKRVAALPPEVHTERRSEPRPYVRPPASAFQNDVTRPIEGLSVEPSPVRVGSRAGMIALALLAGASATVFVVAKSSSVATGSSVVGASVQVEAALRPGPALPEAPPHKPALVETNAKPGAPINETASASALNPSPLVRPTATAEPLSQVNITPDAKHPTRSIKPAKRTSSVEATASKPKSKPNCSPPTYTDAEGIRHFKPECL